MTTGGRDLNYGLALYYAWGRADQGAKLTGPPQFDGGDRAFGFAQAWAAATAAYDAGRRGSRPSVQDAFASWQAGEQL
jgi:hypothetical protein